MRRESGDQSNAPTFHGPEATFFTGRFPCTSGSTGTSQSDWFFGFSSITLKSSFCFRDVSSVASASRPAKATHLPSGDTAYAPSVPVQLVNASASPPSIAMRYTLRLPERSEAKNTHAESGENEG